MRRRMFLATAAVCFSGAAAGCSGGGGGDSSSGTPTSAPTRTPNDDGTMQTGELHRWLEQGGDAGEFAVDVEYIAIVGDSLQLRYVSEAGDSGKVGDNEVNEMAAVAGKYAEWAADYQDTSLRATVIDEFGDPRYQWRCKADWAAKLRNDEVGIRALRDQIAETISEP